MIATVRYELMWNKFLIELNCIPTLCFSSFLQKNHIHRHGMSWWMRDNGLSVKEAKKRICEC